MVCRRNDLLAIMAIAQRASDPPPLCVELVALRFQARGVALSVGEATAMAKELIAAAHYSPPPV